MAKFLEGGLASDLSVTIASAVFVARNGYPEKSIFPFVDWIAKNYTWSIKTNQTSGWRSRDEALARETEYTRH